MAAIIEGQGGTEHTLRQATGLDNKLRLQPSSAAFYKLAAALACAQGLQDHGGYAPAHVGVFARDVGQNGAKSFHASTHAGIALAGSCQGLVHLYEIFEEHRPCWLYFDLEFAKAFNLDVNASNVVESFYSELAEFSRAPNRHDRGIVKYKLLMKTIGLHIAAHIS